MSVPGDPGLEAGLKAAKHDLETATTEAENLRSALGKLLQAAYEAAGDNMPNLELQDTAGEAYRYTLNLLKAGPGGAAGEEQDRQNREGAGPQSEVPAGTAPDEVTAARQRDRLLAAVHEAVRGGPPAAEDRAAYNYAAATADLAGLPDRDAGASEEGGLADQLGQARAENAGLAEEASRLKTGLVTLAAAAGEDAGEAAADLDSEDGVAKAVRFFAAQLQAVPQAAVPAGTAAPAAEGENYQALGDIVRLVYEASGEEMPDLATEDGAAKAAQFLAGQESEVPAGTAPDGVTAAWQRDRLLGAVHEAVRGGPPAAEDRAAYNYAAATADLAGLPDRQNREGAEVSADTAAPAAEGENYQALGDIVRLIYEASGEEMPDLATEDGAAKAAQFLASQEAAVPAGAAAALAGAIRAAYAACGGGAPNLETGDGQDTAQKFLVERMKKLADLETCRAPGAVADGAFIRVIYETSGEEMPDLETPEGYAHAHTEALSDLKASVRRRPEEDEVSTDTSAPAADGGGGENHPSLGGIDPSLGDIVRLVYEASGEEMPDLATEDGAAKAAQFLAGRQAVLAGEVKEIEKAFELRSSNAEKASDGLRKKARDAMDLFKALAVPIEAAFDNAGEAAPELDTPEGVEAVGKFFEALRVRGAAGEQDRGRGSRARRAASRTSSARPGRRTPAGKFFEALRVRGAAGLPDRDAGASEEGGLADQLGQARAENAGLAEEASRLKTGLVTLAAAAGEDAGEAAADLDSEDGVAKAVRFFAAQLQAVPQAAVSTGTAAHPPLAGAVQAIYDSAGGRPPPKTARPSRGHRGSRPDRDARGPARPPRRAQKRRAGSSSSVSKPAAHAGRRRAGPHGGPRRNRRTPRRPCSCPRGQEQGRPVAAYRADRRGHVALRRRGWGLVDPQDSQGVLGSRAGRGGPAGRQRHGDERGPRGGERAAAGKALGNRGREGQRRQPGRRGAGRDTAGQGQRQETTGRVHTRLRSGPARETAQNSALRCGPRPGLRRSARRCPPGGVILPSVISVRAAPARYP